MKILTLTSVTQFADLFTANLELATIPAFSALKPSVDQARSANTCGCGAAKKQAKLQKARTEFENALNNMSSANMLQIKTILKLDQLCYYSRNQVTKQLDRICI